MDLSARLETALAAAIRRGGRGAAPAQLAAALDHACSPGGARIRPTILMSVARACGDDRPALTDAGAAALELIHCASLVHDDLPCFDDAAIRRGRPSVHRAYSEPLAVLAGDSLIVMAFDVLARAAADTPERALGLIRILSDRTGMPNGICAGQGWESEADIDLSAYHRAKTGALFIAATQMGALAAGQDPEPWEELGARIGEAFQVADDLRDALLDEGALGKPAGQDGLHGRPERRRGAGHRGRRAAARRHPLGRHRVDPLLSRRGDSRRSGDPLCPQARAARGDDAPARRMTAIGDPMPRRRSWIARFADPRFQAWAARLPLVRTVARREGEALFDLVSGFAQSQMLRALVELRAIEALIDAPAGAADLAPRFGLSVERTELVLRAGVAMGLLSLGRSGFRATPRGAVLTGVPGLRDMICHHDILYRDLADPLAFLRGETEPDLARFWPYVLSGGADAAEARRYSRLMADSQALVADETLARVDLSKVRRLMDVGGGTGVFLDRAVQAHPHLEAVLVDLPQVLDAVPRDRAERLVLVPASFRDGPLPDGADAISLVRVLYDHDDATVRDLLARAHAALPPGGRLIVSEPMTGGAAPTRPGDVYFALYCAAMGTGRARSARRIATLMDETGFRRIRRYRPRRAFVTSVVEGQRA